MNLLSRPALPVGYGAERQIQNLVLTAEQAAAGSFTLESQPRLDNSGDPLIEVKLHGVEQTLGVDYTFDGNVTLQWISVEPALEEGDELSLGHLPKSSSSIWDVKRHTLTAQNVADNQMELVAVPNTDGGGDLQLAVYYNGGSRAVEGVDYDVVGATLTWTSDTVWVAGRELLYWIIPA